MINQKTLHFSIILLCSLTNSCSNPNEGTGSSYQDEVISSSEEMSYSIEHIELQSGPEIYKCFLKFDTSKFESDFKKESLFEEDITILNGFRLAVSYGNDENEKTETEKNVRQLAFVVSNFECDLSIYIAEELFSAYYSSGKGLFEAVTLQEAEDAINR